MAFITAALLALFASTTVLAAPAGPATPAQPVEERAGAPSNFKIFAGLNPYSPTPATYVVDVKDGNFANGTPLQM